MRELLLSAAVLVGLASAAQAAEETVITREIPYSVRYGDGVKERYVAKYRGVITWDHSEGGGPAEPLKGKFVDDRQCHWTINTAIYRQVCLANKAGQQFCQGALNQTYGASFANGGAPFKLIGLRAENCGDANDRYRSDLENARAAVRNAMQGVSSKDAAIVMRDMKTHLKATEVAPAG